MPEKLNVHLNRKHIGEIVFGRSMDFCELVYSPDWIAEGGYPISPHLNFESSPADTVKRFLANLRSNLKDRPHHTAIDALIFLCHARAGIFFRYEPLRVFCQPGAKSGVFYQGAYSF